MTLTEKKFLNNFLKNNFSAFKSYSNYNLARLTEGFKNGNYAPMYIVNGKLLNNKNAKHIITKNSLLSNFDNYMSVVRGNNKAAARAFKQASIRQYPTFMAFSRNHGNVKPNYYNNYNKPSQLVFPAMNNKPKKVTVTLMPNGLVRSYLKGNTWVEYKGKRYPYVTANNTYAFNAVLRKANSPKKAAPKKANAPKKAKKAAAPKKANAAKGFFSGRGLKF